MDATTTVKNRAAFIIAASIIIVAGVFIVIVGALAFTPVTIVKANVQPYKVITPVVNAGENMVYVANVCKYKEHVAIATRTFVDEQNVHYPLPAQASDVPAGCHDNKVIVPTLPTYHPGKWHIELDIQYQVNLFRTQSYHFKTETFTIQNTITQPTAQEVK